MRRSPETAGQQPKPTRGASGLRPPPRARDARLDLHTTTGQQEGQRESPSGQALRYDTIPISSTAEPSAASKFCTRPRYIISQTTSTIGRAISTFVQRAQKRDEAGPSTHATRCDGEPGAGDRDALGWRGGNAMAMRSSVGNPHVPSNALRWLGAAKAAVSYGPLPFSPSRPEMPPRKLNMSGNGNGNGNGNNNNYSPLEPTRG